MNQLRQTQQCCNATNRQQEDLYFQHQFVSQTAAVTCKLCIDLTRLVAGLPPGSLQMNDYLLQGNFPVAQVCASMQCSNVVNHTVISDVRCLTMVCFLF